MGNTDYFQELAIHTALCNPDHFILWSAFRWARDQKAEDMCMTADCELADRLLDEINWLVGYGDRRTLVSELAPWHQGYLLSGMYANGRNVWRLTPYLTESKAPATFVVRRDPPTFAFAVKQITFPQGRLLQPEAAKSVNGWWLVTPAGVKPTIDADSAPQ